MRKTTKGEGKIEVLRGRSAEVLNEHFSKTGKYAVSDFSEQEREDLDADLNAVEAEENTEIEYADEKAKTDTEKATGGDK
jgi:hypothetical protein